jgi:hypothetical protein
MPLGNGPLARLTPGRRTVTSRGSPTDDPFVGALAGWWSSTGLLVGPNGALSSPSQHDRLTMPPTYFVTNGAIQMHFKGVPSTANFGAMFGMCVLDVSGNGVGYSPYNDGNSYIWGISGYGYSGTGANNGSQPNPAEFWLELRQVSSTTWKGRYTNDPLGVTGWSSYTGTGSGPTTPSQIGLLHAYTAGGMFSGTLVEWRSIA